jgi:hypothetical protein
MIRRDFLISCGGFDERFEIGQDLHLFLKAAHAGKTSNIPETILLYRQHFESINHNRFNEWKRIKLLAIDQACREREIAFNPDTVIIGAEKDYYSSPQAHKYWSRSALSARHLVGAWKHASVFFFKDPSFVSIGNILKIAYRTINPK